MNSWMPRSCFTLLMAVSVFGCAHAPRQKEAVTLERDPKALLAQVCSPGRDVGAVQGSVWLKAKSKEASGQFPGMVQVKAPASLRLEVTNMLGGTEAVLTVDGPRYSIDVPNHENRSQKGSHSWGGIPLRWATELFLGRIPCPAEVSVRDARLSLDREGALVVETQPSVESESERYVYRLRQLADRVWPEALHWEKKGAFSTSVDFKFEDPEEGTGSPKKWEARSEQGEVKTRWRDRTVTPGSQSGR